MKKYSEESLICAARRGDLQAFNMLKDSNATRTVIADTREFLYEQHILDPYTYNLDWYEQFNPTVKNRLPMAYASAIL